MSRDDPQFKLRMPAELRAQAENAAKAAGRSLNSELVGRLEKSFLADGEPSTLIPAKRARELALMARASLSDEIKKRAQESIYKAIRLGHNEAVANLNDLNLTSGIPESEAEAIIQSVICELIEAGYDAKYDDIAALSIRF
ncbi:Arc family DNA-binding protein [Stutzerimonas balearica]|uniref:Arc family DNA-binding protein n=1 Tax=Stutzerimonas balearica TaxID=74829 RepID=UPI003787047B